MEPIISRVWRKSYLRIRRLSREFAEAQRERQRRQAARRIKSGGRQTLVSGGKGRRRD